VSQRTRKAAGAVPTRLGAHRRWLALACAPSTWLIWVAFAALARAFTAGKPRRSA
jgi:hypothetical protein